MTRRPLLGAVSIIAFLLLPAPASAVEPAVVVDGLAFPAGIAFGSTGTMYVSERSGRLLAFDGSGGRTVVGSVPTITAGETGLLGIAVSPDDDYVYAFATEPDNTNTIWRFAVSGGDPERVVTGLPGGTYHNGGGVAFGHDRMLYVSNGETHTTTIAQDPDVLGGKVYRYTPDGDVPGDNPFAGSPAFGLGYRNPFGLAIDPVSGDPFVTENGPESHDEINRVVRGGNGGWPLISGPARGTDTSDLRGRYVDPILDYEDVIVPTGIAFAPPDERSGRHGGGLFFGAYAEQAIHRVTLDDTRTAAVDDEVFYRAREPIVAVAWGPRGLYFSTPDSIQVIPLGAIGGNSRRATSSPAASADDPIRAAPEQRSSSIAFVLFAVAAMILTGALVYAFGPKRRG
ncbi:MAG TPA: PQQ-dependent sugar dehydrogenase, partial [Actinomycetota bacterium]|nr:PQQ-dependent sugar dehydrogenase [Actinomycetota bacterium]